MAKYNQYQQTSLLGLENLPIQWGVKKIKHLFSIGRGRVISQEELEDEGIYPVYSSQTNNNGCLGYINTYDFDCEQITWTTDGANAGTVFLRQGKHNCTNVCGTLQAVNNLVSLDFSLYCLQYVNQFHKRPDTNGAKIMNNEMAAISIPLPSSREQFQISNFLDHETTKIDNLIEKQQQLIELLKEKRQAVISHAVTKGLNPDVPMKDSGVEWLGDVPEHWTVTKLGYHAIKIGSGKTPRGGSEIYLDEGILFLRSQNIYDDGLRVGSSECVFIDLKTHNEMKGTRVLEGDILLNITGGSIGRSCIVPTPFVEANVNQHVCILRFRESIREFISYAMKSSSTKEQIEACQVGGNREGLNFEQTSKINISLPPEEEIDTVLGYLKIRLSQLDTLEKNALNIILLLQERRTALISAAVTGKIDVRDWVAPGTSHIEALEEATA